MVEHSIPIDPGIALIQQLSNRLSPENDREVEQQRQHMVSHFIVESEGGAWISPLGLVLNYDKKLQALHRLQGVECRKKNGCTAIIKIDDSLDAPSGSIYFNTHVLQENSSYRHVAQSQDAQVKARFSDQRNLVNLENLACWIYDLPRVALSASWSGAHKVHTGRRCCYI